jgi:hypothetical protein
MKNVFGPDKPIAVVRFEGTICDWETGKPVDGALARIEKLRETHYVLVVSALASDTATTRLLMDWLITHGSPYDDVWLREGIPSADVWYDDKALKLCRLK